MLDLRTFTPQNRIDLSPYEAIFKDLHSHPELSNQEEATSTKVISHLGSIGIPEIHTQIGGYGAAAVLRNGSGPTVLLRADMDALPIEEQTGLPYASTVRQVDSDGKEKPVMHACGHDMHVTCLLAAAETLIKARGSWSGTIVFVFQPAEEPLSGARAMISDGLFEKVPVPDYVLGQHVVSALRAGSVATRSGPTMASSDSFKITFFGKGSHASYPQNSVDPIIMACSAVLRLQTIVSREVAPIETAVLTVSNIHGGSAQNVIDSEAFIVVNVRTFNEIVRSKIIAAIERIVKAEAQASGATREPQITPTNHGPVLINHAEATQRISSSFTELFGRNFSTDIEAVMATEDFCEFGRAMGKPSVFWVFGGTEQQRFDDAERRGKVAEEIPLMHTPAFATTIRPALDTGVDAMVAAALTFVGKA